MDLLATLLNFSALAVAGMACRRNLKEAEEIKEVRDSLLNSKQIPLATQNSANLNQFKQGEQMVYIEMAHNKSSMNPETYIKRMQSLPVQVAEIISKRNTILEGECGNSFEYSINRQKIKVEMKQCNIDQRALDCTVQPIKLHPKAQASHHNITYTLKKAISLTLIGSLKFNLEANEFVLQPLFLMPFRSKEACLSLVSRYYNDKLSFLTFKRVFLYISIGFLLGTAYYRSLVNQRKQRRMGGSKQEEFRHVQTRAKDKLKCGCGKNMNVIGNCGHLSMCSECYQKDKACKICGKVINAPKIIYI